MRTNVLIFCLLWMAPAAALAGPYGPVIPEPTTSKKCFDEPPPLPELPLDGRLLTVLGFGGYIALSEDRAPFAIVGGVGVELLRFRTRCTTDVSGLFSSRTITVPTIGLIVHGALLPAAVSDSRVSGAVRFSLGKWSKGGLGALSPASFFADVGGTVGTNGPGLAARLGFASPYLLGMGVQYERVLETDRNALLITADLANLHYLIGLGNR